MKHNDSPLAGTDLATPTSPIVMEIASPQATTGGPNLLQQQTNTTSINNGSGGNVNSESSSSVITTAPLAENSLHVEISDALSEKEKVKFTVHTRTTLPGFAKSDNNVVRQHEEFVWLHDRFEENEDYAGYIVSFLKFLFTLRKIISKVR